MDTIRPWRTINVVPLAGTWSNRFRTKAGMALSDPCPAILIQEKGNETRTCFATYYRGLLFPACDQEGYEESSVISGSRTHPYRPDLPPWLRLDEPDPAQEAAAKAAATVRTGTSYTLPAPIIN